jgi:hypothetical protein
MCDPAPHPPPCLFFMWMGCTCVYVHVCVCDHRGRKKRVRVVVRCSRRFPSLSPPLWDAANGLEWVASAMQGLRPTMEDEHVGITSIPGHTGKCFFAVFDGHAGPTVSIHPAPPRTNPSSMSSRMPSPAPSTRHGMVPAYCQPAPVSLACCPHRTPLSPPSHPTLTHTHTPPSPLGSRAGLADSIRSAVTARVGCAHCKPRRWIGRRYSCGTARWDLQP